MLRKDGKIGEYFLVEKCGAGGFGEVWRAEKRTRLAVNEFALKFFRPKDTDAIDIERVQKEIETWKRVSGLPNIVSIFEADIYEDYVYIVSEFADGGSLENWLKANGGKAQTVEQAIQITQGILKGLESLHGCGFVHRDLKPANVLIKKGVPCLADFGISREMRTHSKATSTAGTYEFMPPEAFQNKPSVSVHTDIWSVGVILQKLLTGKLPFPQDEIPSLITAILYNEPEPMPADVPLELSETVVRCLQKDREKRFQTVREVYERLEKILSDLQAQAMQTRFEPGVATFNYPTTVQLSEPIGETVEAAQVTNRSDAHRSIETHLKTAASVSAAPVATLASATIVGENVKSFAETQPKQSSPLENGFGNQYLVLTEKTDVFSNRIILFAGAAVILVMGTIAFLIGSNVSQNSAAVKTVNASNSSQTSAVAPIIVSQGSAASGDKKDFFQTGEDCYLQQNYDCAIENYTKAIKANPKSANAYNNRGISRLSKNEYFSAIEDFTKAIEISPNNVVFYQNRVIAYDKVNDVAQAQVDRQIIQRLQKK